MLIASVFLTGMPFWPFNTILQLHAGNTSIWSTPWCPLWESIHDHLLLPVTVSPLPYKVSDLWIPNTHQWDVGLLTEMFDNNAVQAITSTTPVPSDQQDILRWKNSRKGVCTTKEIYKTLSAANVVQLPSQGSRSIQPQANQILRRAWKSKSLPPLIKTFTWRLIRRALATAERVSRYASHRDKHCDICGQVENDYHLFFQCTLPSEVWSSFDPPMSTANLTAETDGIQIALQSFIPTSTPDRTFHKILFTFWYIWKARNDYHFNRKRWTAAQIHHAVAAHMDSHNKAFNHQQPTPGDRQPHHDDNQPINPGMATSAGTSNEQNNQLTNRFTIHSPALLPGVRCYVNACTTPDQPSLPP